MANLTKGTDPSLPLFFNVDQRVGQAGTNMTEDVALASYLMCLVANAPGISGPLWTRAKSRLALTTVCTPAFIQSIKDYQEICNLSQDGRISPSSSSGRHGQGPYLIANINGSIRKHYPDIWPRIDKINTVPTPQQVAALVQRVL